MTKGVLAQEEEIAKEARLLANTATPLYTEYLSKVRGNPHLSMAKMPEKILTPGMGFLALGWAKGGPHSGCGTVTALGNGELATASGNAEQLLPTPWPHKTHRWGGGLVRTKPCVLPPFHFHRSLFHFPKIP